MARRYYFLRFVRGEVDPSGLEEARPYLGCMVGVIADAALDGLYECEWPGCAKVFRSEKRHEVSCSHVSDRSVLTDLRKSMRPVTLVLLLSQSTTL